MSHQCYLRSPYGLANHAFPAVTWYQGQGYSHKLRLTITLCDAPSRTNAKIGHRAMEAIALAFNSCPESWIASIDWSAFAQTAASFPRLGCISVRVWEGTQQHVAYMQHAHQHLESLERARRIKLDVPKWCRASSVPTAPLEPTVMPS